MMRPYLYVMTIAAPAERYCGNMVTKAAKIEFSNSCGELLPWTERSDPFLKYSSRGIYLDSSSGEPLRFSSSSLHG